MFCSYTWHLTHQTAVQMRMEVGHTGRWKIIIGVPDLVHRGRIMPDLPLQPFLEQCFTGGVLCDSAGSYSTTAQHNSITSYHTSCLPTSMNCTVFLHSHISSSSYTFHCILMPSSGSLTTTTVCSEQIRCLCILISCMLKIVVYSQLRLKFDVLRSQAHCY